MKRNLAFGFMHCRQAARHPCYQLGLLIDDG